VLLGLLAEPRAHADAPRGDLDEPPGTPPPPSARPAEAPPILSPSERAMLARGEFSTGAIVGGAVLSVFPGFGIGQAVQGRWYSTGWIFATGEAASIVVALTFAAADKAHDAQDHSWQFKAAVASWLLIRIGETVDAIATPIRHNARYRRARAKADELGVTSYVVPARGGGVVGLAWQF
jgi:hypothetical protein